MRILALVPGGIGDQILFFPTLETIQKQYPQAVIDVIVEPRAKSAYRVCQTVNQVLFFDFKDRNGLADYLNLLGMIRDREYEVAISLGQRWTVGFLLWLNGIPTRISYQTQPSWFLSNPVPLKTEQYAAQMYHDLTQGLGIHQPCPPLGVTVPTEDIDWVESQQQRLGLKDKGYILIHGGSSKLALAKGINKVYPVAQWQQVIADILQKQPDLPVVAIQGPEDKEWVMELASQAPDLKVITPPDIGKLAATIAGANLMLCTDSAPMHLAVAVGTYTIALFGPTKAKRLLPPDNDKVIGIQSSTLAIADISPEDILTQVWK